MKEIKKKKNIFTDSGFENINLKLCYSLKAVEKGFY